MILQVTFLLCRLNKIATCLLANLDLKKCGSFSPIVKGKVVLWRMEEKSHYFCFCFAWITWYLSPNSNWADKELPVDCQPANTAASVVFMCLIKWRSALTSIRTQVTGYLCGIYCNMQNDWSQEALCKLLHNRKSWKRSVWKRQLLKEICECVHNCTCDCTSLCFPSINAAHYV